MAEDYCAFAGRRLPTELEWERAAAGPTPNYSETDKRRFPVTGELTLSDGTCALDLNIAACAAATSPSRVGSSADTADATTADVVTEGKARIFGLAGNVSEWVAGVYRADVTCNPAKAFPTDGAGGQYPCDCWDCTSLPQTEWVACKEACYTECTACSSDPDCFGECPAQFPPDGLPRCISYGTAARPSAAFLTVTGVGMRIIRGGSFGTKADNLCWVRSADRSHYQGDAPLANVGFRCAANP
jgi:formylglycine-generating enzyme required for sulfatase activity